MKKLILIDSDDTLRRSDGTFSDRSKEIIKKMIENDYYVVICTGRPRYHTEEILKEINSSPIIVSNNGADIYNVITKEQIGSFYIDKNECYKIIEYIFSRDLRLIISTGYIEYVSKNLRNDNQILLDINNYKEQLKDKEIFQCMVMDKNIQEIEKMKQLIINNKNFELKNGCGINMFGDFSWFTFGNNDATKGSALVLLAKYLNIPIENTVAIGNDYNDIPMLKEAGFSVCVDNALDDVKKYVDYITLSNDEDGVAIVLEKIFDGEF